MALANPDSSQQSGSQARFAHNQVREAGGNAAQDPARVVGHFLQIAPEIWATHHNPAAVARSVQAAAAGAALQGGQAALQPAPLPAPTAPAPLPAPPIHAAPSPAPLPAPVAHPAPLPAPVAASPSVLDQLLAHLGTVPAAAPQPAPAHPHGVHPVAHSLSHRLAMEINPDVF